MSHVYKEGNQRENNLEKEATEKNEWQGRKMGQQGILIFKES